MGLDPEAQQALERQRSRPTTCHQRARMHPESMDLPEGLDTEVIYEVMSYEVFLRAKEDGHLNEAGLAHLSELEKKFGDRKERILIFDEPIGTPEELEQLAKARAAWKKSQKQLPDGGRHTDSYGKKFRN